MKNQIQKPATVHRLKQSGKWAVLVTLVEPRELEGRMRSGRQKFERQTQSLANDLCVEINNCLFGKELARQLSPREVDVAKKLFWESLEPKHPEWIEHLPKLVAFCENAGFRVEQQNIPTVHEAAKLYFREHVFNLERETLENSRRALSFILPTFGQLKPAEMTDQSILEFAYGKEPVNYLKSCGPVAGDPMEGIWQTLKKSRSKRPWTPSFLRIFLTRVRAFKNWMNASKDPVTQSTRNWCPPSAIEAPTAEETYRLMNPLAAAGSGSVDWECQRRPALTIPQVQALLDVAWVAWGGKFAPFYLHALWCGSRSKEILRTSSAAFDSKDGLLTITAAADKTDRGRESQLYENAIIMVEVLRQKGLYIEAGLKPTHKQRELIQTLAGFQFNNFEINRRARKIRRLLERQGITLPNYQWNMAYPTNGLRRTSLSMHFKLFQNVALTTGWGGNSPGIFRDYYKRLVTKDEARLFWTMLPTWLTQKNDIPVHLPAGHKLDSAMSVNVVNGVSAATAAMDQLQSEMSQAEQEWRTKDEAMRVAKKAVQQATFQAKRKAARLAKKQIRQPEPAVGVEIS